MADLDALCRAVLAHPEDDAPRLVLADWFEDLGDVELATGLRAGSLAGRSGGYGDYGDDGYGCGDGYGYGYGGCGYGDGDGYGYGGCGDGDGYGYGGGGGGYGGYDGKLSPVSEIADMTDGLYILTLPGGYNPYVIVGWVEVRGLELVVRGGRCVRRFGASRSIAQLAADGPATDTQLLSPSAVEEYWRPSVGRAVPCNVTAWKKDCPRPKGARVPVAAGRED